MTDTTPVPRDPSAPGERRHARVFDALNGVLLVVLAFLLGCQEIFDADIWWHVAAGRWILEHGQVPRLDPFSFASADRPWIDLHWLFEVLMALAHRAGGARGIVLAASALAAATVAVGLTARRKGWPAWLVTACWLPALVLMGTRFDPRPELVTLVLMAVFLAVLEHVEQRPGLIWLLIPAQIVWVNAHGLFVLGPLIVGAYLVDRAVGGASALRWRLLGPAACAVALACVVNPYGLRGTLFPLELLPKISDPASPYKRYIGEFMSLATYYAGPERAAVRNVYFRAEVFLLLALPQSFLLPAVGTLGARGLQRATAWIAGALVLPVDVVAVLGMPGRDTPAWLTPVSATVPLWFLGLGIVAAAFLARQSARAAVLALVGGVAVGAWDFWLNGTLVGLAADLPSALGPLAIAASGVCALLAALVALPLVVWGGGRIFRALLAAAFGYLAFAAIRNANLFGLAGGVILSANLGEWAARLASEVDPRPSRLGGYVARCALASLLVAGIAAVPIGAFHRATGERRTFGFREQPFTYAHDAARFAGQPGMPVRALAFDLEQAGVYVFENGPARKIFMDSRLEVPTRATFETYVRLDDALNAGKPGWDTLLRRLGDPVVLLDHNSCGAEATLLADRRWRCVYYDPTGSVFLPRTRTELSQRFPTVDFAAEHFGVREPHSVRARAATMAEAQGLFRLGAALSARPGLTWSSRVPVLLAAADRARTVLASAPDFAGAWTVLGHVCWNLAPDLRVRPSRPSDPWDPATGLPVAQATYCYRQAVERAPADLWALLALHDAYEKRGMEEARAEVARALRRVRTGSIEKLTAPGRGDDAPLPWTAAEPTALALLHRGAPREAYHVWESAQSPPSQAVRLARLAYADHAALDDASAQTHYEQSLALDPALGDAWFGLALLHAQAGRAAAARSTCAEALRRPLTDPERAVVREIAMLVGADSITNRP